LIRLRLGYGFTIVEITRPAVDGAFPALVFAHGAGTGNHTAFAQHAEELARAGIVCLVPDKQLATYTSFHRDYEAMATEYFDLAQWARTQPWADAEKVGYWGESEGGWIVPISAAMDREPTFLVLVSAPIVTPRQQGLFSVCSYLRNTGVPEGVFHAVPRFVGSPMPGGRIDYADFRVEPYLRRLDCPILMVYGIEDSAVPAIQGVLVLMDCVADAAKQVTVRYYPANHGIRQGEDQRVSGRFLDDVGTWVLGLPATAVPAPGTRVAGAVPRQPFWVTPAPPVNWFGRISVQAWLGAASMAAVAAGPMVRLARRALRKPGRRLRPELRWPFAVYTGGSALTVLAFVAYVARVVHLAVGYRRETATVVWGYRAVRAAAALSVGGGALLALRWRDLAASGRPAARSRAEWWRLASGSLGAAGLLAFGSYWGILPLEPRGRDGLGK
jgi:dienelactone hydrolase